MFFHELFEDYRSFTYLSFWAKFLLHLLCSYTPRQQDVCCPLSPSAYHMIVKLKGFMKVSRRRVKVCGRQFSCMKANMRFTMSCNCSGCWMGWGWMNILGVFNTLWHNFVINKPMFELTNSVRFTEYLRAIFKSLPPNIYISTSASRFDDT